MATVKDDAGFQLEELRLMLILIHYVSILLSSVYVSSAPINPTGDDGVVSYQNK